MGGNNFFTKSIIVILTFDLINSLSKGVMYLPRQFSKKYQSFVKNSSQNHERKPCLHLFTNDSCDFDLWSSELKINRCHVPTKTNQHVKYETSVINNSEDNERNPLFYKVTLVILAFDLVNLKSFGFLFWPRPINMWNIKALWYSLTKVTLVTFTFDLLKLNINKGLVITKANQRVK